MDLSQGRIGFEVSLERLEDGAEPAPRGSAPSRPRASREGPDAVADD
jgi:hypothetical protein